MLSSLHLWNEGDGLVLAGDLLLSSRKVGVRAAEVLLRGQSFPLQPVQPLPIGTDCPPPPFKAALEHSEVAFKNQVHISLVFQ